MHENFKCLATAIFEVPKAGRYDTAKKFSKNASKATTAVHRDQKYDTNHNRLLLTFRRFHRLRVARNDKS
jgi:hypothetical protein